MIPLKQAVLSVLGHVFVATKRATAWVKRTFK